MQKWLKTRLDWKEYYRLVQPFVQIIYFKTTLELVFIRQKLLLDSKKNVLTMLLAPVDIASKILFALLFFKKQLTFFRFHQFPNF